jgi:sec-independent protein translocase protein TatA
VEGALAPWHIIVVAVVFLVLFGAKRLPEAARSLGQSMRIFKAETRGLRAEEATGAPVAGTSTVQPRFDGHTGLPLNTATPQDASAEPVPVRTETSP